MEAAVRCLRDAVAPDDTACCLVLVADDARVAGEEGMETFSSLLREHADAAAAGRAHARRMVLVAGARAPKRHGLEAHARPESGPGASRAHDALAVVDLTRDPHGWLGSIGAEKTRAAAPRLGDVFSVAAAVHDALGGDPRSLHRDEHETDDDDDKSESGDREEGEPRRARDDETVSREATFSTRESETTRAKGSRRRGRRSGLWGRAPRERARTVVALDCVAELVHASGAAETLELIERIRADARVCGVAAYARGGGGDFDVARDGAFGASDAFARAASSLRRAASCAVVVAPPRRRAHHGVETHGEVETDAREGSPRETESKNKNKSRSFLEEADAAHSEAARREADDRPVARLSTSLSRPTGRFRVEHRDVHARFVRSADATTERAARSRRLPSPVRLEVSFRAETPRDAETDFSVSRKENASSIESAEAEAQRVRLERATPFKLGVSAEESLARSRVVLPFEHQGGGSVSDVSARSAAEPYARGDFLRYLPRDAGGESGVAGGGHGEARGAKRQPFAGGGAIVYVRDSEDDGSGSAPDSDEELDEDADF